MQPKILITFALYCISLHASSQLAPNPGSIAGKGFRNFSVSVLNGVNLLQNSDLASWGVLGKSKITPGFDVTIHPSYQLTHVVALGLVYQAGRTNQYSADWLGKTTYHGLLAMGDLNLSGLFPRVDARVPYIWSLHVYGGAGMLGYKAYRKPKQLFDSAPEGWALITDKKLNNRSVYSQLGLGVLYKLNPNFDLEFRAMYVMTGDETFDGSGNPVPGRYTLADINPDRNDNMMTFSFGISYKIGKHLEHLRWVNPLRKMYETNNTLAEEVRNLKSIIEKNTPQETETPKTTTKKDSLGINKNETRITLISPANGVIIPENGHSREQKTFFSWQGFTTIQQNFVYRLKIVEVTDGQTPEQAFKGNKPFFEKDTLQAYRTNKPFFEKDSFPMVTSSFTAGKTYAWAVQVADEKKSIIKTSEVWKFSVAPLQEDAPIQLKLPADGAVIGPGQLIFTWLPPIPLPESGGYRITIVEVGEGQTPAQAYYTNKPFFEKDSIQAYHTNKPFFERDSIQAYHTNKPFFEKDTFQAYYTNKPFFEKDTFQAYHTNKPFFEKDSIQAYYTNKPFFEKDTFHEYHTVKPFFEKDTLHWAYPAGSAKLKDGKTYVWGVQTLGANGKATGKGSPTPFSFKKGGTVILHDTQNVILVYPPDGGVITGDKPPVFTWVPGKTRSEQATRYKLTITEVNNGQTPAQAYYTNKPFFEKDTFHEYHTVKPFFEKDTLHWAYPAGAAKLKDGKTYVWGVQTLGADGKATGKGSPAPFSFKKGGTVILHDTQNVILVYPPDGGVITGDKPPVFTWVPGKTRSEQATRYKLTITEVNNGQTPAQAYYTNKPFFEKDTFHEYHTVKPFFEKDTLHWAYPAGAAKLKDGKTYVWGVQTLGANGKATGKGSPAPFSFKKGGTVILHDTQNVILVYPPDGGVITGDKPPVFTWVPGKTRSEQATRYKLTITEVNNGQTPAQAYYTNKPFFEKDTFHEYHTVKPFFEKDTLHWAYPAGAAKLKDGKTYVWAIEAFSTAGTTAGNIKPRYFTLKKRQQ